MVFSDKPGVIKPLYEMQNSMMSFVKESLNDADILIFIVTVDEIKLKEEKLFDRIKKSTAPLLILINKIDLSNQDEIEKNVTHWEAIFPKAGIYPISALNGFFVNELKNIILSYLPYSPPLFSKRSING